MDTTDKDLKSITDDTDSCAVGCLIFVGAIVCIGFGINFLSDAYDHYTYCFICHEGSRQHSHVGDFILPSILLLIGIGILIWGIYYIKKVEKESKIRVQQAKERQQKAQDDYNRKIEGYEQKYGGITTCIRFSGEIPDEKEFIAFEDTKTLVIAGSVYSFEDIIDAELTIDEGGVLQTFKTKSSLGSTVGRAVVGDIVAGPVGAIIGGSTGSKKTETVAVEKKPDKYTVAITVNKLSHPIVKCDCQENKDAAYNIMATLKVILNNRTS